MDCMVGAEYQDTRSLCQGRDPRSLGPGPRSGMPVRNRIRDSSVKVGTTWLGQKLGHQIAWWGPVDWSRSDLKTALSGPEPETAWSGLKQEPRIAWSGLEPEPKTAQSELEPGMARTVPISKTAQLGPKSKTPNCLDEAETLNRLVGTEIQDC